jgi:hypothetical protein
MIEPQPCQISEPEGYLFQVYLQGAGAAAPTRLNTRNNYTVTRSGAGAYKISFQDDPGPTFMGISGFGFGDATPADVAGWGVVAGAYTPRAGSTQASFTFTVTNAANAAADLAATSTLALQLAFKQAAAVE